MVARSSTRSLPTNRRSFRVGALLGAALASVVVHEPACSVELGPLVSPDAGATVADACSDCTDASVDADAEACAAGRVRFPSGECCLERFSTPLPGAKAFGVVLHGDEAIVYGTKTGRAFAARVSRCDGTVLAETTSIAAEVSDAFGAAIQGDRLVLAGRVGDTPTTSRSLVAWGDATSLGSFTLDLGSTATPSRADDVVLASTGEAWVAATTKPGTASTRAQLRRVLADPVSFCSQSLGGDYGSGLSVALGPTSIWLAAIQNLSIYLYRAPVATCFLGNCDCSSAGKLQVDVDAGLAVEARRMRAVPGGVVLIASTVKDYAFSAGGSQITRVSDAFTVDAKLSFAPSGTGLDRLWDLDVGGSEWIVGGGWRCDVSQGGTGLCEGGRLFALSPSFTATSPAIWERTVSDLDHVSGVLREPETVGGLLVVGPSTANPTDALLLRCGFDGTCDAG